MIGWNSDSSHLWRTSQPFYGTHNSLEAYFYNKNNINTVQLLTLLYKYRSTAVINCDFNRFKSFYFSTTLESVSFWMILLEFYFRLCCGMKHYPSLSLSLFAMFSDWCSKQLGDLVSTTKLQKVTRFIWQPCKWLPI